MPGEGQEVASMFVKIGADISGLQSGLTNVGKALKGFGELAGISLGISGLFELGKASIEAASEAQQSEVLFAASLGNIGVSYDAVSEQANSYLSKIREIDGFHKSESQPALTKLIQMTGNYTQSLKLLSIAANVSRGTGRDLMESATLVGKVYDGNTTILKRFGLQVDKTMTSMDGLNLLQKRFAGDGAAYMQTYAGQVQKFQNSWQDAKEGIGKVLIELLYIIKNAFEGMGDAMALPFVAAFAAIEKGVNWLRANVPGMKSVFKDMGHGVSDEMDKLFANMKDHFAATFHGMDFDKQTKKIAEDVNAASLKGEESIDRFGQVAKDVAYSFANDFAQKFSSSFKLFENGTLDIVKAFKSALDQMVQSVFSSGLTNLISSVFNTTPAGGFGILGQLFGGGGGKGGGIPGLLGGIPLIGGLIPHAQGGVFTSPHVGLVAEKGPEAIIPLSGPNAGNGGQGLGGTTINHYHVSSLVNTMDESGFRKTIEVVGNGLKARGMI